MATTTIELEKLVARLSELVAVWPPVSETELSIAEREFKGKVPESLAEFYRRLDGTRDETRPENGWVRFWPVQEWKTVREVLSPLSAEVEKKYHRILGTVVFADYCQSSWYYAVELGRKRESDATIYVVDGWREPFVVASQFNAFLAAVLVDGPEIYPRD